MRGASSQRSLGLVFGVFGAGLLIVLLSITGCGRSGPVPAWEQEPPPPVEGAIVPASDLHRATLPNGMTLIVLEDHRLPRVALGLKLRRGAGSVDPAMAGVAELAAEIMQRGAGDRDAFELARVVEDAGASLSVSVDWDTTGIALSGLSEDRALLFEILEDVALRPRFDDEEFEKALAEQQAALVSAQDDPATLVQWNALRVLYDGHRYGLPRTGSAESLAGLDVEDARAYWTERFVPRNTIFWAVGDLSASDVIAEAQRRFAALPDRSGSAGTPPTPAQTPEARRIVIVDKPDLVQTRIIIAHEGIRRTEPTRIAVNLMNDALGGSGFSSRLMQIVRAEAGLTYGVGSGFSLRSEPGPFSISTFTRVAEVRRVIDLLLAEMQAIRDDRPIDETELKKFISYNVGRFGLSLETSAAVLDSLVDLDVHGLPADSLDTYRSRIRAVGLEDVAEAARTRLHPYRAAIVILGPASLLVPQLEDLGRIEIIEP
jgi:zinc protease